MPLFFITYQIAQILLFPFFLLYILYRKIKKKPVFGKLSERLGFVPKAPGNHVVWLHAVSVGEVLSIQSLIDQIKRDTADAIVYLTVGTPSGKKMAQEKLSADVVSFLPYDFLAPMLLAFARIKPKHMIIVEAETWPNLLMLAHWKKIPLYLINARISKRSRERYRKFKRFLTPLFNFFEMIYTQSAYDKDEFIALGVESARLRVLGDIKAYNVLEKVRSCPEGATRQLAAPAYSPGGFCAGRCRIRQAQGERPAALLVGSIHPGELDPYLEMYKELKPTYPDLKLILAPRHFHWKEELIEKVAATGYSFFVWNNKNKPDPSGSQYSYDILLVCKLGELFSLYEKATIYFLGGTLVPIGGHNLLEPAVWGKPTIIGPHHHNCQVIANKLQERNALIAVENKKKLIEHTKRLLKNPLEVKTMGDNARAWLDGEGKIVRDGLADLVGRLF